MKSSVDLLHPQVFPVIMDRANYKFCSLGHKFCFKTVLVTFSLSILHEHTSECVPDSLLGCRNWEANEVWAITSHPSPSHMAMRYLFAISFLWSLHLTQLYPPISSLLPVCRLHSHLGSILFKLYHLSKKLFKIITKIHKVMIMPRDCIQQCFSWYS